MERVVKILECDCCGKTIPDKIKASSISITEPGKKKPDKFDMCPNCYSRLRREFTFRATEEPDSKEDEKEPDSYGHGGKRTKKYSDEQIAMFEKYYAAGNSRKEIRDCMDISDREFNSLRAKACANGIRRGSAMKTEKIKINKKPVLPGTMVDGNYFVV